MITKPMLLPSHLDNSMFTLYRKLRSGEFFVVFIDTAGEGSDYNAGHFLSKDSLDIPLVLHYEGSIVDVTPKLKAVLDWVFEETGVRPVIAYETNNGGGYELERLNRAKPRTEVHYLLSVQTRQWWATRAYR